MDSRVVLEKALRRHGIVEPFRLESHVRGCDLTLPVRTKFLNKGDRVVVWVRDGGVPGKYGAPEGETPQRLGIMVEGRHPGVYQVTFPFFVVSSTAATFPSGLVEGVGGWGGGTQYLLPPEWLNAVEQIS